MCSICDGSGWTETGPCRECDGPNLPDGWGEMPGSLADHDSEISRWARDAALEEAAKIVENYDPNDPAVDGRGVLSRAIRAAITPES